MYNLEVYLAENIWREWKSLAIFAAEKNVDNQPGAMTAHELFLAMDDIFHWIVNFLSRLWV